MQGVLVGVRKHRDTLDSEPVGRANDAAGDFTAVGDQYFAESHLKAVAFAGFV